MIMTFDVDTLTHHMSHYMCKFDIDIDRNNKNYSRYRAAQHIPR